MDINNIELPSNKKFGLFFTIVFTISTIYSYTKLNTTAAIVF